MYSASSWLLLWTDSMNWIKCNLCRLLRPLYPPSKSDFVWFNLSGCDSQCRTCDSAGVCTSCRDPTKVLLFGECQYDSCAHQYYLNSTTRTCRGTPPLRRGGAWLIMTAEPAPFMISINDSACSEEEFTAPSVIINWLQMCKQQTLCVLTPSSAPSSWWMRLTTHTYDSLVLKPPYVQLILSLRDPNRFPISPLAEVFYNNLVSSESSVFVQEAQEITSEHKNKRI